MAASETPDATETALYHHRLTCPTCSTPAADEARARRTEPLGRRLTETEGVAGAAGASAAPAAGELIDRYLVLGQLGAGGMGEVVRAYDPALKRELAVKVVRVAGAARPEAHERLLREAQALARLRHPNVITVHDVGTRGDQLFIAMELVEGVTLRRWLAAAPAPAPERVLAALLAAGEGLAAAHDAGLVHRDFKPDNVMMGNDGRVRVLDFGLARETRGEGDSAGTAAAAANAGDDVARAPTLTATGAWLGTPGYMSPEQWRHAPADARSDLWSFCVTLFEALYRVRPFAGASPEETAANAAAGRLAPLPAGALGGERLYRVIARGLAADPAARPASMHELLAALAPPAAPARRRTRAVAALALCAAVVVAAGAWSLASSRAAVDPCSAAAARVDEAWSPAARARLEAAFAAAGVADAPAQVARLAAALDARAGALRTRHVATCRAARVEGTASTTLMDRRMGCLGRRVGELASFVGSLAETHERGPLYDAIATASGLPPAAACDDDEALLRLVPPPDDPRKRAEVARLQARLDAWQGRRHLDPAEAALAQVLAAGPAIEALGYLPLEADALYLRASLEADAGKQKQAEATFARAALVAARAHDDGTLARVYVGLVDLESHLSAHEQALALEPVAQAAIERVGGRADLTTALDQSMGWVLREVARYDEARARYQAAIARLTPAGDSTVLAQLWNGLAVVEKEVGHYEVAEADYGKAIDMATRVVGADHPLTAMYVNNLAVVQRREGKAEDALATFQRVHEIYQRTLPPDHPDQAFPLANYGSLLGQLHRDAEARAPLEEARRIWLAAYGPKHMNVGMISMDLANMSWRAGKLEETRTMMLSAIEAIEGAVGADGVQAAMPHRDLAELLLEMKRPKEALVQSTRAYEIWSKKGSEPRNTGMIELTHGKMLWEGGGDRREAVRLVRHAHELLTQVGDGGKNLLAEATDWLRTHR